MHTLPRRAAGLSSNPFGTIARDRQCPLRLRLRFLPWLSRNMQAGLHGFASRAGAPCTHVRVIARPPRPLRAPPPAQGSGAVPRRRPAPQRADAAGGAAEPFQPSRHFHKGKNGMLVLTKTTSSRICVACCMRSACCSPAGPARCLQALPAVACPPGLPPCSLHPCAANARLRSCIGPRGAQALR